MYSIKLFDKIFAHAGRINSGKLLPEIPFAWHRGFGYCDIAVFTDFSLEEAVSNRSLHKIALLVESPKIFPEAYSRIKEIRHLFKYVLTFSNRLLCLGSSFKRYYLGGCWINKKDWYVYNKSKLVSTIVSERRATEAQKMRHDIVNKFNNKIDVFGKGYNPISYKLTGLKDYAFSIVGENCKQDFYFTEKLIDCFMTGTIPIYYGCPSIGNIFDPKGIIQFDTVDELEHILDNINMDMYLQMLPSVLNNFNKAAPYSVTEYGLWDIFKELI